LTSIQATTQAATEQTTQSTDSPTTSVIVSTSQPSNTTGEGIIQNSLAMESWLSEKFLFTDRRATIRIELNVVFLLRMKTCGRFCIYFPFLTQSAKMNGIKKFSRLLTSEIF
jgi:hypothetical protein